MSEKQLMDAVVDAAKQLSTLQDALADYCLRTNKESLTVAEPASQWIPVSERLPEVPVGEDMHCWLALKNKSSGKLFVIDAYYSNRPKSDDEDCDWALVSEHGEPIEMVGWAERMHHSDFSVFFEPLSNHLEVVAWQPVVYPAAPKE